MDALISILLSSMKKKKNSKRKKPKFLNGWITCFKEKNILRKKIDSITFLCTKKKKVLMPLKEQFN